MKKICFALLCVLFLGLAPATLADEGGSLDSLASAFAEWLARVTGIGEAPHYGPEYPPGGQTTVPADTPDSPLNNNGAIADEPEYGPAYPPGG